MRVWESFIDCMHGNVDKDTLARLLAENVVLNSPFSDEPLTGREAVMEAIETVHRLTTDLTYKEVLSGETHHAAFFRLQIEDTVVNGMDYALLDVPRHHTPPMPLPPPVMAKFLRADPHMPVPPAQITVVPPSATSSIPFT
jgi:hypothetical protein